MWCPLRRRILTLQVRDHCQDLVNDISVFVGNYEVIKQLCATSPEAAEAKKKIDLIIDKCGPPPKGVGIQNLRECIIQTKVRNLL